MKFLKELIARKPHSPDQSAIPDAPDPVVETESQEVPDEDIFANLESIQAKIKSSLNGTRPISDNAAPQDDGTGQVEHFSDAVAKTITPAPKNPELTPKNAGTAGTTDDSAPERPITDQKQNYSRPPQGQIGLESGPPDLSPSTTGMRDNATTQAHSQRSASVDINSEHAMAPTRVSVEVGASVTVVASEVEPAPTGMGLENQDNRAPGSSAKSESIEQSLAAGPRIVQVPAPAAGRAGRRTGRVKTRLLGFEHAHSANSDPFDVGKESASSAQEKFPVGWIVVVSGPGRGSSFTLFNGVSQIGRGDDQAIKLDFGDTSISRNNHAAIAYDNEQRAFFLGHGGKANLVRLNNKPVLSTEELSSGDLIRIGETTLRFVGLCGSDFDWESEAREKFDDAASA